MTEREELDRLNMEIKFHEEQLIREKRQRDKLIRCPVFKSSDQIHMNGVVMVEDAPRSGEPWGSFENGHLDQKFMEFIHEKAKRQGRTTKAIRYKLLYFLLRDLPLEDLYKKTKAMIYECHGFGR